MKYDILNGTEDKISRIALGTDVYGSVLDCETSISLLDNYCELGGNVIDTASVYGGEDEHISEKLIGRWLKSKGNRDKLFISTKGGHPKTSDMSISRLSPQEIESDIDKSLQNLGVDYIDIYWLHRDDISVRSDIIMDTLDSLVKRGKTRYIGMSNWTCGRIDGANAYAEKNGKAKIISSQIQYSAAHAVVENNDPTLVLMNDEEYDYFSSHDLSVFAFASQAKGFFSKLANGGTGALSEKARDRYLSDINMEIFNRIKTVAKNHNATVGEIVIASLICNNAFQTIPIIGCKNITQLTETLSGADVKLSQEECDYILLRKHR